MCKAYIKYVHVYTKENIVTCTRYQVSKQNNKINNPYLVSAINSVEQAVNPPQKHRNRETGKRCIIIPSHQWTRDLIRIIFVIRTSYDTWKIKIFHQSHRLCMYLYSGVLSRMFFSKTYTKQHSKKQERGVHWSSTDRQSLSTWTNLPDVSLQRPRRAL